MSETSSTLQKPQTSQKSVTPAASDNQAGSAAVLEDNREAQSGLHFDVLGSQFALKGGQFVSKNTPPSIEPKGNVFNTNVKQIADHYKGKSIEQALSMVKTNYMLQLASSISSSMSLIGLQLPSGSFSLGVDMGIKQLSLASQNANEIKAKALMGFAGIGAAQASVATGVDIKVAAIKVKGMIKGSADFSLGDVTTTFDLKLKEADNFAGREVESYSFDFDIKPELDINLEGSLSLRSTYFMDKLAQDWAVLYVKGLYFGASGQLKGSAFGQAGSLMPTFKLSMGDAWHFDTVKKVTKAQDIVPLAQSDVVEMAQQVDTLKAREQEIFGEREDKFRDTGKDKPDGDKDKPKTKVKAMGMLESMQTEMETEALKTVNIAHPGEAQTGLTAWFKSKIWHSAQQTALTTLKDNLEKNGSLLAEYSAMISKALEGRSIKLGKYLSITIEKITLHPETGLTFEVSQSVELFGSWLKSKGTIQMQYDLFYQHAYHFQYDLQGKDVLPRLAPFWRIQSSGITMSMGNQSLTLNGLNLTDDELLVERGQLALKLPSALGGHGFLLDAKGLKIGDTVSWDVLVGKTTSSINIFGQKSLVLEKLVIGSKDHQDGTKGVLFATSDLKIDLFNTHMEPKLRFVWDIDSGQFIGTLTGLEIGAVKIDDVLLSDRGFYIGKVDLTLKQLIDKLPKSISSKVQGLDIEVTGFKITKSGITITSATATIPQINAGPLIIENGQLGVTMNDGKATGFHVAGKAELELWGLKASSTGRAAFKDGKFDRENSGFEGSSLNLGVVSVDVDNLSFLPDSTIKLTKPTMVIQPGKIGDIKGVGQYVPNWLTNAVGDTQLVFSAQSYESGKGFTKPRFIPLTFKVPLGGGEFATFHYDKDSKKASLTFPALNKKWQGVGAKVEVPLLYGFAGLEVGGGIEFATGFAKESVVSGQYDDSGEVPFLNLDGNIELFLSAGAKIHVGIYAGVPKLITISGGVYAKASLLNTIKANAGGKIAIGGAPDWQLSLDLDLASQLHGEVGAYIGYTIVGISGTKDIKLAEKDLAEWTYVSHISIGQMSDVKGGKKVKFTANPSLNKEGVKSEADIRKQLDMVAAKNQQLEHNLKVKTAKVDDTLELHQAVKTKSSGAVDKLMKDNERQFAAQIRQLEKIDNPSFEQQQRLMMLKQQHQVWSKWHPGRVQLFSSRSQRIESNLKRRQKALYHATMQLMHDKTVNIKTVRTQQLDDVAEVLDSLNEQLAQAKQLPPGDDANEKIAALKSRIANFEVMYEGFEKAANTPVVASYWDDVTGSHKSHIAAAVKADGSILQEATTQVKIAQANYKQAVQSIQAIAKKRQKVRERSGAQTAQTRQELEVAQQIMTADHNKWYQQRKSFWRKLVGKSQDSIIGAAMTKLQQAELELEFAIEKLAYTKKLSR